MSDLTLESALSLMNVTEEKPAAAAAAPAAETPPATEPAAAAETTEPNPADAAPAAEADPNPPSDEGITKTDGVDQGALPLIEPPASWKTEEKEVWEALPRKAQEAISRREQAATSEVRNLQNSSAEQRRTAEAEVTRIRGIAGQVDAVLNEKVANLSREFPEIKSEADIVALAQQNPARAQLFQAKLMELNAVSQTKQAALAEVAKVDNARQQENLVASKAAMLEAFPAWKDPVVARKEIVELQEYAIKQGASEVTARSALDPVVYKMAQKAMLYDKAQAAKTAAVTHTPPRVVKPGAQIADPKAAGREASRSAQLGKLQTSGDIEDARGLLRA